MDARKLILRILTEFDNHPGTLERIVDTALSDARIDHRDKRFIFEIAYGIIRRRLTLDYQIDRLLDNKIHRKNAVLRHILQIGLYQIFYMDRVPDHAAVNESVNLAKHEVDTQHLTGVVNGVLRKVLSGRHVISLENASEMEFSERLSIEYSHPCWLIDRWLKNFGLGQTKQLMTFNNTKPDVFLRRKIRGLARQQFEADVRSLCDPATGYLNLYYRLKKALTPEFISVLRQGLCNIQAPSSGWVTALMDVSKGDKVLDICSSPGGKTAILSELVGDTGTICACDSKWHRTKLTLDTVQSLKLTNVYLLVSDGCFPPFEGVFDKVLVDAPCTATGVFHRHPDARWVRKPSDVDDSVRLQRSLLESAARLLGRGGILVYSTCSIEPEENALQVQSFLRDHTEFVHAGCPGSIPQNYIDKNGFLAITPFLHGMDGMFGARLKKIGDPTP
jgi:16S rRNA (cytosine967-C5)-methyltransferase